MDVILGRVDVGDHRVDRGVGVGQQPRRVAADRLEPADRAAELEEMAVTLGNGGGRSRRVPGGLGRDPRHALEDGVQPRHAATADVDLAQEQIRQHAQQRHRGDDHHPRDP